jgi:Leucine-rich repeat (LRR) protein
MNCLRGYSYSSTAGEFDRLALLTHLNLSNSCLSGQIPIGISRLINLVSLDLSSRSVSPGDDITTAIYSANTLQEPNFQTLVANLSNLRELYLDEVYIMSSSGEGWGKSLARYVPRLQVLSLRRCRLNSAIDSSLSSLSSLVAINLGSNNFPAGPVPEFFADFLNLRVLQLSNMSLKGLFPQRFFELKNLRVLDLSFNPDLLGYFPKFSHANSLETLRLEGTNFFYDKRTSSSNLKSLKELGLGGKFLSLDFLSSFGLLGSVRQLEINQINSKRDLGSILSWIRNLKNLKRLTLFGCDFSLIMPSSIANLNGLVSLTMFDCNLPRPILSAIGNLRDLQDLAMSDCKLHGSMTSSIGNLTDLRSLYMESCEACGPMPAAIGHLKNLKRLTIINCEFAGAIPSAVGNLTNLKSMVILLSHFPGPIPYAIGQLKELTQLVVEVGSISGRIPSSIGNLTQLEELSLYANYLSGKITLCKFNYYCIMFCISWKPPNSEKNAKRKKTNGSNKSIY